VGNANVIMPMLPIPGSSYVHTYAYVTQSNCTKYFPRKSIAQYSVFKIMFVVE